MEFLALFHFFQILKRLKIEKYYIRKNLILFIPAVKRFSKPDVSQKKDFLGRN